MLMPNELPSQPVKIGLVIIEHLHGPVMFLSGMLDNELQCS